MAVGAHRHQIAAAFTHPPDDLGDGIAEREHGFRRNPCSLEFAPHRREIGAILGDFRADGVRAVGPRGPAISNVQHHDTPTRQFRERLDVLEDRAIRQRAVDRDENRLIHTPSRPRLSHP